MGVAYHLCTKHSLYLRTPKCTISVVCPKGEDDAAVMVRT